MQRKAPQSTTETWETFISTRLPRRFELENVVHYRHLLDCYKIRTQFTPGTGTFQIAPACMLLGFTVYVCKLCSPCECILKL